MHEQVVVAKFLSLYQGLGDSRRRTGVSLGHARLTSRMLEGKETEEISTGFQSDTTYQCKPRVKISSGGGHKRAAEQKVESSNCVGGADETRSAGGRCD